MNAAKRTVFVVDDDASFLTAIERLLRAGGYACQTFTAATALLKSLSSDESGCILADLHMPACSGLELQEALAKNGNALPIIFLTGHGDIPASVHAMKHGAEDFLTKPVKREILFAAIERAFVRNAQERQQRTHRYELLARFDTLTPREREVLEHVVSGQMNKQIAGDLDTCERTIKAHRSSIMAKLQVHSVAELVRLAHAANLIN
jgi:two-component system, LuxR family, response regulator FixJ